MTSKIRTLNRRGLPILAFALFCFSVAVAAQADQVGDAGAVTVADAARPLNPCNPCGGKAMANPCNPCGGKAMANPCNPCGGKANPCNPCNPCGGAMIDPARFKQPAGFQYGGDRATLLAEGKRLWNDRSLGKSGLACASCHIDDYALMKPSFAKPYPHRVEMPYQRSGVPEVTAAEMVNFCMLVPMNDDPLAWNSSELAALATYVENIQGGYTTVASNPCGGKAMANPCNPCGGKAMANPCNPCGGKANPCNPCNPCGGKANPCNPCNPCGGKANPCNPCGGTRS